MKTLTALAVALLAVAPLAAATPPNLINYQGVLRDAGGNPATGSFEMVFRLYDQATGGTLILTDYHAPSAGGPAVDVTNGLFSVEIGSGLMTSSYPTLSAAFGALGSLWLEIQVNAETLSPRLRFASAGYALNAGTLAGQAASGFVNTSSQSQTKSGILLVGTAPGGPFASLADTGYGVIAKGSAAAGTFTESDTTAMAELAKGGVGVTASGPFYGAYFGKADFSAYAYLGNSATGIQSYGLTKGGYFRNLNTGSYADLAAVVPVLYYLFFGPIYLDTDVGINARGEVGGVFTSSYDDSIAHLADGWAISGESSQGGGNFWDKDSSGSACVGCDIYKIQGTGSVAFVQNHPSDKDKVIVYNAPEGDEVATYTRGSARLAGGEARIPLGETFAWVTNPELGLTAYVTPVGEWADLYVVSKTTKELVVRSRDPHPRPVEFDYIVYGLRIGFEEASIVQEKKHEAFIPSMADHRKRHAEHPELRRFEALQRMKAERASMGLGVPEELSASAALRNAIHEFDPNVDKPIGFEPRGRLLKEIAQHPDATPRAGAATSGLATPRIETAAGRGAMSADADAGGPPDASPAMSPPTAVSVAPQPQGLTVSVSVSEAVEPGDVLAFDPERPGMLRRSATADSGVAGVVADGAPGGTPGEGLASVTLVGIALCKVDAGYGAIRAGDLLIASPTPGHAMRTLEPVAGTILGKAIDSLDVGTSRIRILVMTR